MQNKPKLSIITSIYNGGKATLDFLQCISNQTYENIELILVDDCSTDKETIKLIEDIETHRLILNKPYKLIKNTENLGLMKAFQKGLDNATGEYFAFPESDDLLDLDFYEVLMNEVLYQKIDAIKGLMLNQYSDRNLLYNKEMTEEECQSLQTINIVDKETLPVPIKNTTGQIISYIMPDITYSWFYVFSKDLLSEGYEKPMFENAVLYGVSNSIFSAKYKEVNISLDKGSFYYYNAHNPFEDSGYCIPIIDKKETKAKNAQLLKLTADALILEKFLNRYKKTIDELK